ncbi:MAG: peptidoglycan-binding domain-containing protein [Candidatus Paceibacteria bacterium]
MFTISAPRITIRFVALLTAVSLVLSAFPAAFFVANAEGEIPPVETSTTETPVEEVTTPAENTEEPVEEVAKTAPIDESVASARLVADKIICDDEADLPNWGSTTENPDITADTAEDWVEAHEGCYFAKGWEFEWAPYGSTGNPGDTLVGPAGAPWTTFSYSTTIPESAFETGIWVREVLQDGYIPFTYNPGKVNNNPVSAELYCHKDVLNYDNFDYVGGLEDDTTYYCVAWNVAEEAEPTYTVEGYKFPCYYNEYHDERSLSRGDFEDDYYCDEGGIEGWEITASNGDYSTTTITNEYGYYSFKLPAGDWMISEEDRPNWEQVGVWQNNDEVEGYCSFELGNFEPILYESITSVLLDDVETEESQYRCDFGNYYYGEPEYQLTGSKWNDLNANGVWDKDEPTLAGWTITATNGEDTITTTTDEDGDYEFWVPAGTWTVSEIAQSGWTQTGVEKNGVPQEEVTTCTFTVPDMELSSQDSNMSKDVWYSGTRCDFGNHKNEVVTEEKPRKNGSSGTRTKRPQGQVLGATTQCGLWLNDYMQKATENDTYQVLKLQVFLNLQGYVTPLTGIFDDTTEANVKFFQAKYADTVIKPWFEKGIVPHNRPTGFVYKTTRWQINDIMCPGIEPYPSFEGENLSTNVLIKR